MTGLFNGAPDLLEDFKQFLPESAAQHRAQQAARHNEEAALMGNARGEAAYAQAPSHQQTPRADTSRLPPMGNFAPTPTANRDNKRKRGERQIAGAAAPVMPTQMTQEAPTSNIRSTYAQGNGNKVRLNSALPVFRFAGHSSRFRLRYLRSFAPSCFVLCRLQMAL